MPNPAYQAPLQPALAPPIVALPAPPSPPPSPPPPDYQVQPLPAPVPFPIPPVQFAQLPEARRPFNVAWEVHDLGHMNVVCSGCGALHWIAEKLTKSSLTNPKFGMCCFSGKIDLPKLHEPIRKNPIC